MSPVADGTKGSYLLIIPRSRALALRVGKAGILRARPGYYVYAGSAFGPGGLKARVGRHLAAHDSREGKRLHWHIDYLLAATPALRVEAWCEPDVRRECEYAARLAGEGGVVHLHGYGASDCRCESHLYYFEAREPVDALLSRYGMLRCTG